MDDLQILFILSFADTKPRGLSEIFEELPCLN